MKISKKKHKHYFNIHIQLYGCALSNNKKNNRTRYVEEVDCFGCKELLIKQGVLKPKEKPSREDIIKKKMSDAIPKLTYAFSIGLNVSEACVYAKIARDTYYRWIKENVSLSDRFKGLRKNPTLKARATIYNNLGDPKLALRFLSKQKRTRNEFSNKVIDIESDIITPIPIVQL